MCAYSGISVSLSEKKEVLPPVTVWRNLKDAMLNEISRSPRNKHHMIPLTGGIENCQPPRNRGTAVAGPGVGG